MLRDTLQEAVGNLLASRQRSILALIGILIGAGAVIAMLNVGAMAQNETAKQFEQMGTDILSMRSTEPAGFKLGDVEGLRAAVSGIVSVAPFVSGGATVIFEGTAQNPSVLGVTGAFRTMTGLHPLDGRFISDFDRFELYCVVGSKLAADLSRSGYTVRAGSDLRVGGYQFRVLSTLPPIVTSPMLSIDVDSSIFISIPNSRRVLSSAPLGTVIARVRPGVDPEAVSAEVTAYFDAKGYRGQVQVQTAQQLIEGMASQMRLFEVLLGAVGGIALVLGGVGVMNIMLVSVQERHREIGIRLAIGARRRDIQGLFLSEAAILALLGALLGIGLGIAGSYVFARISSWDFMISPIAAPLGAGVSLMVGIFFGFYPAFMASHLDPIQALRSE